MCDRSCPSIDRARRGCARSTWAAGRCPAPIGGAIYDDDFTSMIHLPYRGDAPALTNLLGGQVQLCFAGMTSSIEYVRTSKLRALAVTTVTRLGALPDFPTVGGVVAGGRGVRRGGGCER